MRISLFLITRKRDCGVQPTLEGAICARKTTGLRLSAPNTHDGGRSWRTRESPVSPPIILIDRNDKSVLYLFSYGDPSCPQPLRGPFGSVLPAASPARVGDGGALRGRADEGGLPPHPCKWAKPVKT